MRKTLYIVFVMALITTIYSGNAFAMYYDPNHGWIEDSNFKVEIVKWPLLKVCDTNVPILVKITNLGEYGTQRVEVGIYKRNQLDSWGAFSVVNNIANCKPYEKNVATKEITLGDGESITEIFYIPQVPCDSIGGAYDYAIYAGAYRWCWTEETGSGLTSYDRQDVFVWLDPTDVLSLEESCQDGLLNQDETDTDCGGSHCSKCENGYRCNTNSDCASGYCGRGYDGKNRCMNVPDDNNDGKPDYDKYTGKTKSEIVVENKILPIIDKYRNQLWIFGLVVLAFLGIFILMIFKKGVKFLFFKPLVFVKSMPALIAVLLVFGIILILLF